MLQALAYGINNGCEPLSSMMHLRPEIEYMNMVNPELQLQWGKHGVPRIAALMRYQMGNSYEIVINRGKS